MHKSPTRLVIIGGGVVGLALFRKFSLGGYRPLLLEAGEDILSGASKANSAILHTGFDAPAQSLELSCIKTGRAEYLAIYQALNLPVLETGALLAAWNEEEARYLPVLAQKAQANGIHDIDILSAEEVLAREPALSPTVKGALHIAGEYVIDPWSTPLAYALQGLKLGGEVRLRCKVLGGNFTNGHWRLLTSQGLIEADWVINAAGLYGDIVESIARPAPFTIHPRKGQFAVFDKSASKLLQAILLPVPSEKTKGIVMTRTIFGNLLVGPTAEDQESREMASTDPATIDKLIKRGCEMVPALANYEQTALYAGLRPATQYKDYQIELLAEKQWVSVNGIRSTGLSAALGIASHVANLWAKETGDAWQEVSGPSLTMPNLSQYTPRPYQTQGDDIICHCEWVTAREIKAALRSPLPARDLHGVKRRTRALMGRCQGFYCGAKIAALLHEAQSDA